MSGAEMVGSIIDRLLERRYGKPYSSKWWAREHAHHRAYVTLACPNCPSAAELGARILRGDTTPMSYNDFRAAMEAVDR